MAMTQMLMLVSTVGFSDDSALLKHELAYCLGQIKNTAALPTLEAVLANEAEDPMVRHEVGPSRTVRAPFLISDTYGSRLRKRWVQSLHRRVSRFSKGT